MTAKTPTLGNIFSFNAKVRKDPNEIVNGALDLFTKAQAELEKGEAEITKQLQEDQLEIERLQAQKDRANEALGKLGRVKLRIQEFTL